MFSSRLPRLTVNPFSQAVARLRAQGTPLLDVTETNPTAAGLPYPDGWASALADPRAERYGPAPRGTAEARNAVARACSRGGRVINPERLVLTASTSEAYSVLFKLLANPGDEVLVPQPSYPLFDLLTGLDAVTPIPYQLRHYEGWSIDRTSVEAALTSRSRALLIVSPNNPTGSMLRARDREWLVELAVREGVALIADEVFAEYPLNPLPDASSCFGQTEALTFTLGGLSKSAGMPQMKLAWIVVSGPAPQVEEALERLDAITDTYLSVSTPVQVAADRLLRDGEEVRAAIQARITGNLSHLRSTLAGSASADPIVRLLEPEGGWSAVLHLPLLESEEALVMRLLEEDGVIVHPGYFFDFAAEGFLVMSLLPPPSVFAEAVSRVLHRVRATRVLA